MTSAKRSILSLLLTYLYVLFAHFTHSCVKYCFLVSMCARGVLCSLLWHQPRETETVWRSTVCCLPEVNYIVHAISTNNPLFALVFLSHFYPHNSRRIAFVGRGLLEVCNIFFRFRYCRAACWCSRFCTCFRCLRKRLICQYTYHFSAPLSHKCSTKNTQASRWIDEGYNKSSADFRPSLYCLVKKAMNIIHSGYIAVQTALFRTLNRHHLALLNRRQLAETRLSALLLKRGFQLCFSRTK